MITRGCFTLPEVTGVTGVTGLWTRKRGTFRSPSPLPSLAGSVCVLRAMGRVAPRTRFGLTVL
jgi:hypothetical protein